MPSSITSKKATDKNLSISGVDAIEILNRNTDLVALHKKDNTDKFWSYKLIHGARAEFAFDPKTKTKLTIRFDRKPPAIEGIESVVDISRDNKSTALGRVFSGNAHQAKFKALVRDEKTLLNVLSALADA
ncbi:hypothetical protein [Endozoicomonas atrinae]|uniref:hypothetical protein n=1 Tax=Endozoicomonas atrinae TaxID=1333660 RepID=UPI000824F930|nr:hypothetical protein [Endozoicomonas atrinae]